MIGRESRLPILGDPGAARQIGESLQQERESPRSV